MNLFTYLLSKKGKNSLVYKGDLFSYLLGKKTPKEVKTVTGTIISITDATREKIVNLTLSKESTQDGTPTPSNPVQIKTVKGYRNLFDLKDGEYSAYGITAIVENGEITLNGTATANSFIAIERNSQMIWKENTDYTVYGFNDVSNSNVIIRVNSSGQLDTKLNEVNKVQTINTDTYNDRLIGMINIRVQSGTTLTNYKFKPMLIEGTNTSLPYVPYGTNWVYTKITNGTDTNYYTIPLNDNEICGIGDYKDELIIDKNGHCWLNKKTGKIIFDGSESGWVKSSNINVDRYVINTNLYLTNINSLCNYFSYGSITNYTVGKWNNNVSVQMIFNFANYGTTTLEDWKTWLSSHNLELLQPLVTPELIDLNYTVDMTLFEGVNNISNSDDMDMILKYY